MPIAEHFPVAQAILVGQPMGPKAGVHPNMEEHVRFFPSAGAIAKAWEEHFDKKRKRKYWYNSITKEVRCRDVRNFRIVLDWKP